MGHNGRRRRSRPLSSAATRREDLYEIGEPGLFLGVVAHFAVGVGYGLADLLNDRVRLVDQVDSPERRTSRTWTSCVRMLEVHHSGRDLGHGGLGTTKVSP